MKNKRITKQLSSSRFSSLKDGMIAVVAVVMIPALLAGCRAGGDITVLTNQSESIAPTVNTPSIAIPSSRVYYSGDNALTIIGLCENGYTVSLNGDFVDQTTCTNSVYSFEVEKSEDGFFSFSITQKDESNIVSIPANLVWVRKTSISPPVIETPTQNPYPSAEAVLTMSGKCETGATVSISGDGAGSTICRSSSFTLSLPKAADGDFSLSINQTDLAGNTASAAFVWNKKELTTSPSDPTLVVARSQIFTILGGTPPYTMRMISNSSGGSLDAGNQTYTLGTLAEVTDVIEVEDALGFTETLTITSTPELADHLTIVQGQNQIAQIGTAFSDNLQVQVVDRYENAVSGFPVLFQVTQGDARIQGSPIQTSDSNGYASVSLKAGYHKIAHRIRVSAASGVLPDIAASGRTSVSFQERSSTNGSGKIGAQFTTQGSPAGTLNKDLNGDGVQDMVVINQGSSSVGVFLGKGNGLYQAMVNYPMCSSPPQIQLASLNSNSDSLDEIIAVCPSSDRFSFLQGFGNGQFINLTSVSTATHNLFTPIAMVAHDFDLDSHIDVALAFASTAQVGIYWGNGDGSFDSPSVFSIGIAPNKLIATDVDKNGLLDLVATTTSDSAINLLVNAGSRSFGANLSIPMSRLDPIEILKGDLNEDTFEDLIVLNGFENAVSVFINNQSGSYNSPIEIDVGSNPASGILKDFDGDTHLDLILGHTGDSTLGVMRGVGDGTFGTIDYRPSALPIALNLFDGNSDGTLDLFITSSATQTIEFLPGDGMGAFGFEFPTQTDPQYPVATDFNADGNQDLLVVNGGDNSISLYQGLGNGLFQTLPKLITATTPREVIAEDFNQDGAIDILVTHSGLSTLGLFLGNNSGSFPVRSDLQVGTNPRGVAAADLNRDSVLDIITANQGNNRISVLLGNGDGTFQTRTDYNTGTAPSGLVISDFNNDGRLDVSVVNSNEQTVGILLGNGNGTFQAQVTYDVGVGATHLACADLNLDGSQDIITSNFVDGTLTALRGAGDGSLGNRNDFGAGSTPGEMIIGDFDRDSRVDVATVTGISGTLNIFLGLGNGSLASPEVINIGGLVNGVATSDFNNDGTLDIVVTDGSLNRIRVLLGQD